MLIFNKKKIPALLKIFEKNAGIILLYGCYDLKYYRSFKEC
jgi:hypothetical protein